MFRLLLTAMLLCIATLATPAYSQDREVPYWVSIRTEELNMRVGPSRDYRIEWVYKRKGLPLRVLRVVDGWRLVEDPDGEKGWVVQSLLSIERSAIVTGQGVTAMRAEPASSSTLKWNAAPGVVGYLGKCENGFCEFDAGGRKGWVSADRLWGAGKP